MRSQMPSPQQSELCAIYFAFLAWDSVRARHIASAETAMRPSHGRRSRNVMTMFALSWSFIESSLFPTEVAVDHMMRRSAFDTRPHPTNVLPQSMKRLFH